MARVAHPARRLNPRIYAAARPAYQTIRNRRPQAVQTPFSMSFYTREKLRAPPQTEVAIPGPASTVQTVVRSLNTSGYPKSQCAIAYLRVSTERQGRSGLGIEAQRAPVRQFAESEGLTLIGEEIEIETG